MIERLAYLDAHDALFLLRNCFAIPKLLYTLRASPCFQSHVLKLKEYDDSIRDGLARILNSQLGDAARQQASMPVGLGGLGVRSATDLSLPAFLASSYGCRDISAAALPVYCQDADVDQTKALSCYQTICEDLAITDIVVPPPAPEKQASWDFPLIKAKMDTLLAHASTNTEKARLLAVTSPHAGDWLNAVPVPSLGLKLDNHQLRIAAALRLGSPLCQPHTCICGTQVDASGVHGLSCKKSAGRFPRHHQVNDLIKRALGSAGFPSVLEPLGISREDGKRPDGMTLFPWKTGKSLVWDFTCCDTLAPSHLASSSTAACKVAERAEADKMVKYANLKHSHIVNAVCIETLGSWGSQGLKLIQDIGSYVIRETGEPRSTAFLLQAMSMAVQRGNAVSVIGTVPGAKSLDEVFYM